MNSKRKINVGKLTSTSKNIYVATGYGEWGMTNGTAAAGIVTDIITKNKSPYEEVYCPSRHIVADGIGTFIKENFDVAKQLIKGKLQVGEYKGEHNIHLNNDEGTVVDIHGQRYGAYRDKNGKGCGWPYLSMGEL